MDPETNLCAFIREPNILTSHLAYIPYDFQGECLYDPLYRSSQSSKPTNVRVLRKSGQLNQTVRDIFGVPIPEGARYSIDHDSITFQAITTQGIFTVDMMLTGVWKKTVECKNNATENGQCHSQIIVDDYEGVDIFKSLRIYLNKNDETDFNPNDFFKTL